MYYVSSMIGYFIGVGLVWFAAWWANPDLSTGTVWFVAVCVATILGDTSEITDRIKDL